VARVDVPGTPTFAGEYLAGLRVLRGGGSCSNGHGVTSCRIAKGVVVSLSKDPASSPASSEVSSTFMCHLERSREISVSPTAEASMPALDVRSTREPSWPASEIPPASG
jgi:hypothetical protein